MTRQIKITFNLDITDVPDRLLSDKQQMESKIFQLRIELEQLKRRLEICNMKIAEAALANKKPEQI